MHPQEFQGHEEHVNVVLRWLQEYIVDYNLCPFAKKPLIQNQIRIEVVSEKKRAIILEKFFDELKRLDDNTSVETTLLVFPFSLLDFYQYLEICEFCDQLLIQQGYEGVYQLASFHPGYFFEGEESNDSSHFTNRSPYPIIHILREDSIEQVLKTYKKPEDIPVNNIALMRKLGADYLQKKLKQIVAT